MTRRRFIPVYLTPGSIDRLGRVRAGSSQGRHTAPY